MIPKLIYITALLLLSPFVIADPETTDIDAIPTLSVGHELPENEDGYYRTRNKYGWMAERLDPFSREFVAFSKDKKLVVDIGTAYGNAVLEVLKTGSAHVIANDMETKHIEILKQRIPLKEVQRVTYNLDHFPDKMDFESESIDAILAARIFHFLKPEELEQGVQKIKKWLVPGGKVYVFCSSPYRKGITAKFREIYELRKKSGVKFPGVIENLAEVNPSEAEQLPIFFHYLDLEVLTRLFEEAGFRVERGEYIGVPQTLDNIKMNGRENVGIVAVKPEH